MNTGPLTAEMLQEKFAPCKLQVGIEAEYYIRLKDFELIAHSLNTLIEAQPAPQVAEVTEFEVSKAFRDTDGGTWAQMADSLNTILRNRAQPATEPWQDLTLPFTWQAGDIFSAEGRGWHDVTPEMIGQPSDGSLKGRRPHTAPAKQSSDDGLLPIERFTKEAFPSFSQACKNASAPAKVEGGTDTPEVDAMVKYRYDSINPLVAQASITDEEGRNLERSRNRAIIAGEGWKSVADTAQAALAAEKAAHGETREKMSIIKHGGHLAESQRNDAYAECFELRSQLTASKQAEEQVRKEVERYRSLDTANSTVIYDLQNQLASRRDYETSLSDLSTKLKAAELDMSITTSRMESAELEAQRQADFAEFLQKKRLAASESFEESWRQAITGRVMISNTLTNNPWIKEVALQVYNSRLNPTPPADTERERFEAYNKWLSSNGKCIIQTYAEHERLYEEWLARAKQGREAV